MRVRTALLLLALALQTGGRAGAAPDLPPQVGAVALETEDLLYPAFDASGQPVADVGWRVVKDVGNCCENYFAVTSSGRILNFGGSYLRFTDTRGLTWSEVRPIEPVVSAEGAVTVAPNGDVVGMTWDPYSGDRVMSFKLDAASQTWHYGEVLLHTPSSTAPGSRPCEARSRISARPTRTRCSCAAAGICNMWHRTDPSTSASTASITLRSPIGWRRGLVNPRTSSFLDQATDADADWNQPLAATSIAPLAGGGAMSWTRPVFADCHWSILDGTAWSCFSFPDGSEPQGALVSDSRGWLHDVEATGRTIVYRLSTDGGRSWLETRQDLPEGYGVERLPSRFDHKALGTLGVSVVAVHATRGPQGPDQDMVFKFGYSSSGAALEKLYLVGHGDQNFSTIPEMPRYDFVSVGFLPDGKIVASFGDADHLTPATAIEL